MLWDFGIGMFMILCSFLSFILNGKLMANSYRLLIGSEVPVVTLTLLFVFRIF